MKDVLLGFIVHAAHSLQHGQIEFLTRALLQTIAIAIAFSISILYSVIFHCALSWSPARKQSLHDGGYYSQI